MGSGALPAAPTSHREWSCRRVQFLISFDHQDSAQSIIVRNWPGQTFCQQTSIKPGALTLDHRAALRAHQADNLHDGRMQEQPAPGWGIQDSNLQVVVMGRKGIGGTCAARAAGRQLGKQGTLPVLLDPMPACCLPLPSGPQAPPPVVTSAPATAPQVSALHRAPAQQALPVLPSSAVQITRPQAALPAGGDPALLHSMPNAATFASAPAEQSGTPSESVQVQQSGGSATSQHTQSQQQRGCLVHSQLSSPPVATLPVTCACNSARSEHHEMMTVVQLQQHARDRSEAIKATDSQAATSMPPLHAHSASTTQLPSQGPHQGLAASPQAQVPNPPSAIALTTAGSGSPGRFQEAPAAAPQMACTASLQSEQHAILSGAEAAAAGTSGLARPEDGSSAEPVEPANIALSPQTRTAAFPSTSPQPALVRPAGGEAGQGGAPGAAATVPGSRPWHAVGHLMGPAQAG